LDPVSLLKNEEFIIHGQRFNMCSACTDSSDLMNNKTRDICATGAGGTIGVKVMLLVLAGLIGMVLQSGHSRHADGLSDSRCG
jgi:hypothetical protein